MPHVTVLAGCTQYVMCRSCWCFEVVRCYNSLIGLFVDILQLLSGCMHPMLSITGSIVCQSHVTFTSICVCMCSCWFFMKSLTHDFDYIDNFVTFLFYVGRSHHLQNYFKNKQFKQGFEGNTRYLSIPSIDWLHWHIKQFVMHVSLYVHLYIYGGVKSVGRFGGG